MRMSGHSTYEPEDRLRALARRAPADPAADATTASSTIPTPKNLNYWWTFGGILSLMLGVQIVTGIVLAMHYAPHAELRLRLASSTSCAT